MTEELSTVGIVLFSGFALVLILILGLGIYSLVNESYKQPHSPDSLSDTELEW